MTTQMVNHTNKQRAIEVSSIKKIPSIKMRLKGLAEKSVYKPQQLQIPSAIPSSCEKAYSNYTEDQLFSLSSHSFLYLLGNSYKIKPSCYYVLDFFWCINPLMHMSPSCWPYIKITSSWR